MVYSHQDIGVFLLVLENMAKKASHKHGAHPKTLMEILPASNNLTIISTRGGYTKDSQVSLYLAPTCTK